MCVCVCACVCVCVCVCVSVSAVAAKLMIASQHHLCHIAGEGSVHQLVSHRQSASHVSRKLTCGQDLDAGVWLKTRNL